MDTPEERQQKMLRSIEEKTGIAPNQIVEMVKARGLEKHSEKIAFIKAELGLSHGYANLLAHKTKETSEMDSNGLLENQYKGKEHLFPIYQKLIASMDKWEGIDVAPKKTYVSLRTKKQFAIVQPSTKQRVDLGLNLKGMEPNGILEESGSFNAMVSHRIRLSDVQDINKSVLFLLNLAYEQSK